MMTSTYKARRAKTPKRYSRAERKTILMYQLRSYDVGGDHPLDRLNFTSADCAHIMGLKPSSYARELLWELVDAGKIRVRWEPHIPDHPIEALRTKAVYSLPGNYADTVKSFLALGSEQK